MQPAPCRGAPALSRQPWPRADAHAAAAAPRPSAVFPPCPAAAAARCSARSAAVACRDQGHRPALGNGREAGYL
eukprot:545030-Prymnesium_polylepis.2